MDVHTVCNWSRRWICTACIWQHVLRECVENVFDPVGAAPATPEEPNDRQLEDLDDLQESPRKTEIAETQCHYDVCAYAGPC